VLGVSQIPYGRPGRPDPWGVLDEWRGTCSTKHLLLAALLDEREPENRPRLFHRVYLVSRELASTRWGPNVAAAIPPFGLVDVHTYVRLRLRRDTLVDVTFPVTTWDGTSDLPLACGPGDDFPAGHDPLATKADLVRRFCDPSLREPFIAVLTATMND